MPFDFQQLANFRLARGSHKQPNKGGNICVNEAAVIAAGFQYREIKDVSCLPDCFSRPMSEYAIYLNDFMMHRVRNELLVPFITRLPGTSDAPWVEEERGRLIVAGKGSSGYAADCLPGCDRGAPRRGRRECGECGSPPRCPASGLSGRGQCARCSRRSSPQRCGCWLSKICSERLIHPRLQNRIVNFGTLPLGSPEGVRKLSLWPQPVSLTSNVR